MKNANDENIVLVPITLRQAKKFVDDHHRHNVAPQGHKFSIGCARGKERDELVGVVIVGRPIARANDDKMTAEILRVCVLDGVRNANSKLYGAAIRACKAMGYKRVLTYTLPTESGSSLKAVGMREIGRTRPCANGWDRPNRKRKKAKRYPEGEKIKWEITFGG